MCLAAGAVAALATTGCASLPWSRSGPKLPINPDSYRDLVKARRAQMSPEAAKIAKPPTAAQKRGERTPST